jgi:hypothetical protein
MMARSARRWIQAFRGPLLLMVGILAVMVGIGFAVDGWNGAEGGLFWGTAAVAAAFPGVVLTVYLTVKYGPPSNSYHSDDY